MNIFARDEACQVPDQNNHPKGEISLSHIDTHVGLFFSHNYSNKMKFMCFLTKFESISKGGNIWCHYMFLIVTSRGVCERWIYPTLLSTTAEHYPTVPVMGENNVFLFWNVLWITRRNATIHRKLKGAIQSPFSHHSVDWMAGTFQWPLSDHSVPFSHHSIAFQ